MNPRSKDAARSRILGCLTANPGLTAQQVGRALGLRSNAMRTLKAMQYDAVVIAVPEYRPDMGRTVSVWHVAPPGTVPPLRSAPDPDALARRRELRAQIGPLGRFSSLKPGPVRVPDLSAGVCRAADPDLFFAPEAEAVNVWQRRVAAAKAICVGCPVRDECLAYALESRQAFGIWGGADERERRAMLRRQAERRAS